MFNILFIRLSYNSHYMNHFNHFKVYNSAPSVLLNHHLSVVPTFSLHNNNNNTLAPISSHSLPLLP